MSYFWRLVGVPALEPNPVDHLPITVCGWAVVFASFMVVGKSQTLFDLCYFWTLGGSIFALITPTVLTYTGPTRYRYYQFWLEHTEDRISPRVLYIGDSISCGTRLIATAMTGKNILFRIFSSDVT